MSSCGKHPAVSSRAVLGAAWPVSRQDSPARKRAKAVLAPGRAADAVPSRRRRLAPSAATRTPAGLCRTRPLIKIHTSPAAAAPALTGVMIKINATAAAPSPGMRGVIISYYSEERLYRTFFGRLTER